jgi:hypothetical protein
VSLSRSPSLAGSAGHSCGRATRSTASSTAIDQRTCNGQPNQQFQIVPGSSGYGAPQAQNSGDGITVMGSATSDGTPDTGQEPASSSATSR